MRMSSSDVDGFTGLNMVSLQVLFFDDKKGINVMSCSCLFFSLALNIYCSQLFNIEFTEFSKLAIQKASVLASCFSPDLSQRFSAAIQ